ncbi:MAG: hypothetical protein ACRD3C_17045 [Vicinamibacterales bacterium]
MRIGWTVGGLFVLSVAAAEAQQLDARWAPWLGCWQLVDENVRQDGPAAAARARSEGTRVCVVPAETAAAVTLSTRIEDQPVLEQTIAADGAQHPIDETGCRGWQRAEWSRTGDRLFSRAELSCTNEAPRTVSGLAMITGGAWIDVQAIDVGGREHIRVRRYRKVADRTGAGAPPAVQAESIAPRLAARRFTLEDVKEAAAKLSPRAVEAALVETNASFDLNSRALVDLDQAGVPDSVIDLMVALSFPDHFIVDRARPQAAAASTGFGPGYGSYGPYSSSPYDGLLYDGFWDSPYVPYYYSPFGYAYWAGYGMPYYPLAGFVTIDPAASSRTESTGGARLVNGVGYTQVRPRDPEPVDSSTGSSGTRSGGSSTSGGSSSSGGSSGGASSGGFSSGGSSTDTGRTAEPR